MYETLGRMTGRSYEETVQVLNKGLKNAESQIRMETMVTFGEKFGWVLKRGEVCNNGM